MSAIDPAGLPTLADTLDRGEDPTSLIEAGHLRDSIQDALAIADVDRARFATADRATAVRFAQSPPADGDNRQRVLGLLWAAELVEDPELVARLIDAVADPTARAALAASRDEAIAHRRLREETERRRRATWRAPAPGSQWHHLDHWNVELLTSDTGQLDPRIADVRRAVTEALEGFAPELETILRRLLPAGVDVQVRVHQ